MDLQPASYDKDYEITDAMFGAFRSPGGMPFFWKLFGWFTLLYAITGFVTMPMMLEAYLDFLRILVDAQSDPENVGAMLSGLGAFFGATLLFSVIWIILMAVVRAAFFRGYFFGETQSAMPLRLGWDELRQALAILGYYAAYVLFVIFLSIALFVIAGLVVALALMIVGDEPPLAMIVIGAILYVVVYVAMIAAIVWFMTRLSCAGALTALRGRTHVLAARKVSANRFWPLLGSYLVAGLIAYVVSYVAFMIGLSLSLSGLGAADIFTMMSGLDPEASFEALDAAMQGRGFRFASALAILLISAGYAFYGLFLAGPQAFFTKQWAEAATAQSDKGIL